jgi:hypothetical protein
LDGVTEHDEAAPARKMGTKSISLKLAWIAAYSFSLLMLLRFGARTYPGWYFPHSPFLNSLLNGSTLFTGIGYDLVLLGAAAGAARVLLGRNESLALQLLQWGSAALTILIVGYGLAWAIWTARLPWQPDGAGRYPFF